MEAPEQEVGVEVGLADQAGFAKTKTAAGREGGEGVTRGAESGVRDEGAVDTPHRDPWKSRT